MKKALSVCLFSTALLFPFAASAQAPLVRFDSGISVVPVRAGPAANIVRGVNPGGQPWVISRLTVDIKTDGRISVDGRGLLLGGGDAIGTNGNQSVRARLFCGPAPGVTHDSVPCRWSPTAISVSMELSRRGLPLPAQVLSCSSSVEAATGSLPGFSSKRGRAVATGDKVIPLPASARWQRAPVRRVAKVAGRQPHIGAGAAAVLEEAMSASGRYCCKSLLASLIANFPGRTAGVRIII